jgi:dephospho-CoA kinase
VAALRLGLTGGIGSGKSTVAQFLAHHGAVVVDADAISRATTACGGSAIAPILSMFGAQAITADGSLDREAMRALVFADPAAKARLEGIVHPLVGQEIAREAHSAESAGAKCIVFDIPLLVESGHWRRSLQRVLVVDCTPDTQLLRVMARSGLQAFEIERIIAAQATRAQRLAAADLVLCNDGISLDELAAQTREIAMQFGL